MEVILPKGILKLFNKVLKFFFDVIKIKIECFKILALVNSL